MCAHIYINKSLQRWILWLITCLFTFFVHQFLHTFLHLVVHTLVPGVRGRAESGEGTRMYLDKNVSAYMYMCARRQINTIHCGGQFLWVPGCFSNQEKASVLSLIAPHALREPSIQCGHSFRVWRGGYSVEKQRGVLPLAPVVYRRGISVGCLLGHWAPASEFPVAM